MSDTIITVDNLSKAYLLGRQEKQNTLFGSIAAAVKSPLTNLRQLHRLNTFHLTKQEEESDDILWALRNVSFEVKRGEVLGIIGRNGAGKSTLLKILSRIAHPTHGRAEIRGRVSALLEVGTGFHPELSGRENVYMNGTILGMRKAEIDAKFDEIVDFSGVEKFLDTPVKRYSSGMKVRLAFAVAAHLEPEILIIDEVLAVGDAEFQKKCLGKMESVATGEGRTVLFVSHNMAVVRQLTSKGILLRGGEIVMNSGIEEVVTKYEDTKSSASWDRTNDGTAKIYSSTGSLSFLQFYFPDSRDLFALDEPVIFVAQIKSLDVSGRFRVSLTIFHADGTPVGSTFSDDCLEISDAQTKTVSVRIPDHRLAPGKYYLGIACGVGNNLGSHLDHEIIIDVLGFEISQATSNGLTTANWTRGWGTVMLPPLVASVIDE